jgi:cytochrome oxidase Cu insertion factor (SCO1/SenC/PrrC family)
MNRWIIVAAGVIAIVAVVALLWPKPIHGETPRAGAAQFMQELMSGRASVGGPFALSDADGRERRLSDFKGRLVLLYFGYATCPDVCPTDLAAIGGALRALGERSAEVQPIFVTLDPQRDTPPVLRAYVGAFHPRFIALRGSDAQTREVATRYKVFYERAGDFIDHAAFTFLIDREGQYVAFFPPGTRADRMATMVKETL